MFRRAVRDGTDIAVAAEASGIPIAEARLTIAEDAKYPPPPEAYELLGHNSEGANMSEGMGGGHVAADELRLLIERVERLEEEMKGIADDIKDVFAEAKSRGYDVKAIRKIVAIRKKKREEYQEEEAILETYMQALGMLAGTPLGDYSLARAA